jgi:hypothetical protein
MVKFLRQMKNREWQWTDSEPEDYGDPQSME